MSTMKVLFKSKFCKDSTPHCLDNMICPKSFQKYPKYPMLHVTVSWCVASRWEPEAWGSVWTDSNPCLKSSHPLLLPTRIWPICTPATHHTFVTSNAMVALLVTKVYPCPKTSGQLCSQSWYPSRISRRKYILLVVLIISKEYHLVEAFMVKMYFFYILDGLYWIRCSVVCASINPIEALTHFSFFITTRCSILYSTQRSIYPFHNGISIHQIHQDATSIFYIPPT